MKKLLGFLYMSLFVLGIFSVFLYLKEKEPNTFSQIMGIVNIKSQTADKNRGPDTEKISEIKLIQENPRDSDLKEENEKNSKSEIIYKDENKLVKRTESNKLSSITKEPITEKVRDNIPKDELKSVQKADMLPLEGIGEEIEDYNTATDEGELGEEYSFPELFYPYRAMLNKEEQRAYDQIFANAQNYNNGSFKIQASINISQLEDIMMAVYNDHPELFWLETQFDYQYGRNGKVYSISLKFNKTIEDLNKNKVVFNEKVNEIINLANEYETDVEKERFVHDYLNSTTTYDESAPMHQSAYSALVNGRSVCAGYSRAFQHIMMEMGIPTYYCTGVVDGGDHAWNIIKLDDNYYNVDALWDDSVGERYSTQSYLYFNIPDSEFNIEHRRTGLSVNLPACIGTDMAYEVVFGSSIRGDILSAYGLTEDNVINSLEEYYEFCIERLSEAGIGQSSFTVALKDRKLFDEVYKDALQEGYMKGYINEVAENLDISDYRISLEFSVDELPDGYVLLTQYNNFITR